MPRQHHLSDANSPGTASQGVAHWAVDDSGGNLRAVTDRAHTQNGLSVVVAALDNDIGDGLTIVSAIARDAATGSVSHDGVSITFTADADYGNLDYGESTTITVDYRIQDSNGDFDDGFLIITIERPPWLWVDEDDALLLTERDLAIIADPGTARWVWADEDGKIFIAETGEVEQLEGFV